MHGRLRQRPALTSHQKLRWKLAADASCRVGKSRPRRCSELLWLHLPLTGECVLRTFRRLLHPAAQLRLMNSQIGCRLDVGNVALVDQPHSLKLELARSASP